MNEKSPNENIVIITDRNRIKRERRAGFLLSTTALICVIVIFIFTILMTAAITYSLAYNIYYLDIDLDNSHSVFPPLFPGHKIPKADDDLRLPTALKPVQYLIKLQPFIDEADNFTFSGYEQMTFHVVESTNQIIFHINDIDIHEESIQLVAINGTSTDPMTFTGITYDTERMFFIGTVATSLETDVIYDMTMNFTGYLNDNLVGFYRSVYQDEFGKDVLVATTQFEATDARRAFPCFDEPALKARFEIHILRKGVARRSVSNMPRISTYEADPPWEGWYWDIFDNSLPMSSYLVAFVVSDFFYNTSDANDHVTFRVWTRESALYQASYALSLGPDVLTFYENFFNIPFPLPKQDMVTLPDFDAGAMENWGLITYRESAFLYDPVYSAAINKQRVGDVVAHELAHQWFGDLVSPSWWTYVWLNEGFASYMEYTGLDGVEPSFGMLDQFVVENNQNALSLDCLESSHPISIEVTNPDEISELFDSISYNKGASILRMMEYFLTIDTLKTGLTNYLNGLSYSSATEEDLWDYLTEAGHADGTLAQELTVNEIMDTWTSQMGFPLITVTRSDDGTWANVTQERFLLVKNPNSTDTHNYMWWVPITFTTQDNPDFTSTYPHVFMQNDQTAMDILVQVNKARWVIFNIKAGSYYRVNYDDDNWNLLIAQLQDDLSVITLTNRAQIIDDALNLARGGVLNYDIALEVNSYLSQETEFVPWSAALNSLNYLEEMFTRKPGYGAMKDYLLTLLIPPYDAVGFEDSLTDAHLVQLERALVSSWACHLDHQPCVDNSILLYAQWMAGSPDNTIVSPNLKPTVFCTGIAEGDSLEWDFAYEFYLSSNLASDKDTLLSAMGCSRQIWILERYLEMAFTEEFGIRKQDSASVFYAVANNDIGRDVAWEYLQTNWDSIAAYEGSYSSAANFANYVTSEFNTEQELKELILLRDDHIADLGTATQPMEQAIENVINNINWMNKYYSQINQWLVDKGYGDMNEQDQPVIDWISSNVHHKRG